MRMCDARLLRGRPCWNFYKAPMRRGRIWRIGTGKSWREGRNGFVMEMPCGAPAVTSCKGSFDCGNASHSRSATFAQDDNCEGGMNNGKEVQASGSDQDFYH